MIIGDPVVLSLKLHDQDSTKYVESSIHLDDGTLYGTRSLTHIANGLYLYFSNSLLFPSGTKNLFASYVVYNDILKTMISSTHQDSLDIFTLGDSASSNQNIFDAIQELRSLIQQLNNTTLIATVFTEDSVVGNAAESESIVGILTDLDSLIGLIKDTDIVSTVLDSEGTVIGELQCT